MKKLLMLLTLPAFIISLQSHAQKRYGYTVLYFRCGDNDSQRDRVYYSPVIELNTLNFPQYTDGVDPSIPQFSVRYYNYAISRWFEIYLKDKYKILINTSDRYARKSNSVVFNEKNKDACNSAKTDTPCFFMDKEEIAAKRQQEIDEGRSSAHASNICEVIDL